MTQSILVSALSLILGEQILSISSLPQILLHHYKQGTLANVQMFCNQSPRWKRGHFGHRLSCTPYLQWNDLNIGKLWRQSALMPYAFIWSFSKLSGLPWLDTGAQKGQLQGLHASGPRGPEPSYILYYSNVICILNQLQCFWIIFVGFYAEHNYSYTAQNINLHKHIIV